MIAMTNIVMSVAMAVGFGGNGTISGKAEDGVMAAKSAVYVVHFENRSTGYPVMATMAFTKQADAEAFARVKQGHGYTVRVSQE